MANLNVLTTRPTEQVIAAIQALDLEPVKVRMMDSVRGEGWTREHADSVEVSYKSFLTMLVKHPEAAEEITLSEDADEFWHTHILQTRKYADDCLAVFGGFLHHSPELEDITPAYLEKKAASVEKTRRLYEQEFGASNVAACGATIKAAACGANVAACGASVKAAACGANVAACGASVKAAACGANVAACGASIKAAACGASVKAAACGASVAACGASIKAAACGASVAACGASIKAAACGASFKVGKVAACGASTRAANTAACGASIRLAA
jgi:hypothetical protein